VLKSAGKRKESDFLLGSEPLYLLAVPKVDLTRQNPMYKNMDYTQFVKRLDVQTSTIVGAEGQRLS